MIPQLHERKDLQKFAPGDRIGPHRVLMLARICKDARGAWKAKFRCRCGKEFVALIGCVSKGNTQSCGCHRLAVMRQNGRKSKNAAAMNSHPATAEVRRQNGKRTGAANAATMNSHPSTLASRHQSGANKTRHLLRFNASKNRFRHVFRSGGRIWLVAR